MEPDYEKIATQAVGLLCSVGCWGLDPSRQRELWQRALDLDRQLHPSFVPVTVWTEAEGDVEIRCGGSGKAERHLGS